MTISEKELEKIVGEHLDEFYRRRLQKLTSLKPKDAFKRKNPYLFKAIGTVNAVEFIKQILTAYMSSSDEGIFGDAFFEPLAKSVSQSKVSAGTGLDIEIHTKNCIKAIAVKSGTAVYNSSSKTRQNQTFVKAQKILYKEQKRYDAIVGYCYGSKISKPGSDFIFRELAGQSFWEELTGDPDFYLKIIRVMKDRPAKHKIIFEKEWSNAENRFLKEFLNNFCDDSGTINWESYTEFNSGKDGSKKFKKTDKGD